VLQVDRAVVPAIDRAVDQSPRPSASNHSRPRKQVVVTTLAPIADIAPATRHLRSAMLGPVADGDGDVAAPAPIPASAPASRPTVDELLAMVGGGDRSAFAALYDETAPRLFGLVRRLVVDPAQAEEVTQDVYLEIWQTAPRFDAARGSAVAWMFTIAHRRAVDRVRSSQASRERDVRVGARDLDVPVDTVAEAAEARVEHERVTSALGELSELQRECVALAYYGGLSQREIADRLGVPLGTVKTRLRDGMIRLRTVLGVRT
jgi:RNA polymerase sigma-70 factor (ECF subfamily)